MTSPSSDEWRGWRFAGIYGIRHIVSQKIYVGQSQNVTKRIGKHKRGSSNRHLRHAIQCHGWDAFEQVLLERVDDLTLLTGREQFWIDYYDAANPAKGYNASPTAGATRGWHPTDEMRAQNSARRKGVPKTPEWRAAIRAAANRQEARDAKIARQTGVPMSQEARANMRAAQNRPDVRAARSATSRAAWARPEERLARLIALRAAANRPEVKTKRSAALMGVPKSPAQRAAISEALKGVPKSPAHCMAISAAAKIAQNRPAVKMAKSARFKGIAFTPAHCAAISISLKGVPHSAKHRAAIGVASRRAWLFRGARQRLIDHMAAAAAGQLELFSTQDDMSTCDHGPQEKP